MVTTMSIKAFFDGIGKTYVHFVSAIVMNVANVVLCWALIFGHLGAPVMGAPGAGLGAFIATWIGFGIMIFYAMLVRRDFWPDAAARTSWSCLLVDARCSRLAAAATVVMMVGFGLFARTAADLDVGAGARVVQGLCGGAEAANSAANTDIVETLKLTFTACMAFGTATATLIGQSLGRKQPDEAQKWGWASVRLGLVIFGVVGLSARGCSSRTTSSGSSRTPSAVRGGLRSCRCGSWGS